MQVVTREQWGARRPNGVKSLSPDRPRVWVHHTVTGTGDSDPVREAAIMRQIQAHHMDSRGWSDIGYNFVIFQSGRIYEGRGWGIQGAHSATDQQPRENEFSYGIAAAGNFQNTFPTNAMLHAYADLIRFGLDKNFIAEKASVGGHRQVPGAATACPGQYLYGELDEIRRLVTQGDETVTQADKDEIVRRVLQGVCELLVDNPGNPGVVPADVWAKLAPYTNKALLTAIQESGSGAQHEHTVTGTAQ